MSSLERFHRTTSHWVLLSLSITNLVLERVPPLSVGGEVKLLQCNSHLSQELVPPEAVPVPHTQPESAAQQGRLRHLVLQWEGEEKEESERRGRKGEESNKTQQNTTQHNRGDLLHMAHRLGSTHTLKHTTNITHLTPNVHTHTHTHTHPLHSYHLTTNYKGVKGVKWHNLYCMVVYEYTV